MKAPENRSGRLGKRRPRCWEGVSRMLFKRGSSRQRCLQKVRDMERFGVSGKLAGPAALASPFRPRRCKSRAILPQFSCTAPKQSWPCGRRPEAGRPPVHFLDTEQNAGRQASSILTASGGRVWPACRRRTKGQGSRIPAGRHRCKTPPPCRPASSGGPCRISRAAGRRRTKRPAARLALRGHGAGNTCAGNAGKQSESEKPYIF